MAAENGSQTAGDHDLPEPGEDLALESILDLTEGGLDIPREVPRRPASGTLGWLVTVADHRDAYIQEAAFQTADQLISSPAEELDQRIHLDVFSSVVVMSHHLATDRIYLRKLADTHIPYIGLLGPRARRDRLIAELEDTGQALSPRVYGPVGIDIHADSPGTIALGILAQIQKAMAT